MKRILALTLVLIMVLSLSACGAKFTNDGENNASTKITLTAQNAENIISAYDTTLFVINPDKTVSVSGTNNGHCEVSDWTDIEKIFATRDATYGIQSNGTCLVSENYTSFSEPKFNNAIKITQSFVLLGDGTIVSRFNTIDTKSLPKCTDILQTDDSLFCVTQDGYVRNYSFDNFENETELSKRLKNLSDIKEINYYKYYGFNDLYHLSFVDNSGNAYTYYYSFNMFHDINNINQVEKNWPTVTSCVPAGRLKYIATTTEYKVVGCGDEFDEIGGNIPKILLPENALKVFNFYGMNNGKNFGYAIVICEDFSAIVYHSSGSIPYNMSHAFSKWNSFEIS